MNAAYMADSTGPTVRGGAACYIQFMSFIHHPVLLSLGLAGLLAELRAR